MIMEQIPTVDLNAYIAGDPAQKSAFIQSLGDSFSQIGFAIVDNHGVPAETIAGAYEAFQAFFALPQEVKDRYDIPGLAGQRGYTGRGKEHAKDSPVGDLKEFFHLGQEVPQGHPLAEVYPPNIFPPEVPGVQTYGLTLFQALERSGAYLLRAIAEYLGLPVDYFDDKVTYGNSILRPIHYFPIEKPELIPPGAVRAAAHEDINLITLLIGASAEGLEVLHSQGKWLPVSPEPHQIVINVGDMLQRLTNDRLKSTTHRVVNPPLEKLKEPRYSMPFFLHPVASMDLTCLEACVDEVHPKKYKDMTAGAYLEQRLREIGLLK